MLRYASTVRCPDRRTLESVNGEIESYLRIGVANLRKQKSLLVASYEKYGARNGFKGSPLSMRAWETCMTLYTVKWEERATWVI